MTAKTILLDVDYLVVGAGATGLAFVDEILSLNAKATVAIVDKYSRPGGHWTTAYPFVRLHQPSKCYGVSSKNLGADKVDEVGLNKGLFELATVNEICAYYDQLMHATFLPSGRVQYFRNSIWNGDRGFHEILTGQEYDIGAHTKVVDTTYVRVMVPSMRPPPFPVASGVNYITLNEAPKLSRPYSTYTVIGAGKTGMDACLWLLSMGIEADQIAWIVPRDSWLYNRKMFDDFASRNPESTQKRAEALMAATDADDFFHQMVTRGLAMRLDDTVKPTKFRCATVSTLEFEQLRRIKNVIRLGRVQSITADEIVLERGSYPFVKDTIFIDGMSDGEDGVVTKPIFAPGKITIQSVRLCQPVFSAAFIAFLEATYEGDSVKNGLSIPTPNPNYPIDQLKVMLLDAQNVVRWSHEPKLVSWLANTRLNFIDVLTPLNVADEAEREVAGNELRAVWSAVIDKVQTLIRASE